MITGDRQDTARDQPQGYREAGLGDVPKHAHAGSRTRVTSMGGLYDAATLRALVITFQKL